MTCGRIEGEWGGGHHFCDEKYKNGHVFRWKNRENGIFRGFRLLHEKCTIVGSPAKCAQTTSARPATESHDIHRKRKNKNNKNKK